MSWITKIFKGQKVEKAAQAKPTNFADLRKQISQALYQFISFGVNVPIVNPENLESYIDNGYAKNADVYTVVEKILSYARRVKTGLKINGEEVDSHPALDLLNKPNPIHSKYTFKDTVLGYYLLLGNSYIYKLSPSLGRNAGKPIELWPLPAQHVEAVQGDYMQPVTGYVVDFFQNTLDVNDTIHIKRWNPQFTLGQNNWVYGMPPLKSQLDIVRLSSGQHIAQASLVEKGGIKGIVSGAAAGEYTQEGMEAIKKAWEEKQGANSRGDVVFTSADLKFINMIAKSTDLDLIQGMRLTFDQICNAYGINSQLFSTDKPSTFNNIMELKQSAYDDVVLPLLEIAWFDWLNTEIAPRFGDNLEFFPDTSGIAALQKNKKEVSEWMKRAGVFTDNEIREALDYGTLDNPEAEKVWANRGETPKDEQSLLNGGFNDTV